MENPGQSPKAADSQLASNWSAWPLSEPREAKWMEFGWQLYLRCPGWRGTIVKAFVQMKNAGKGFGWSNMRGERYLQGSGNWDGRYPMSGVPIQVLPHPLRGARLNRNTVSRCRARSTSS